MEEWETIQGMHTRFTTITNKLGSLIEVIPTNELVRETLSVLPPSWESKINAITKARYLEMLILNNLIGNLKTYELKKY